MRVIISLLFLASSASSFSTYAPAKHTVARWGRCTTPPATVAMYMSDADSSDKINDNNTADAPVAPAAEVAPVAEVAPAAEVAAAAPVAPDAAAAPAADAAPATASTDAPAADATAPTTGEAAPAPTGPQQAEYGKTLPVPDTYIKCGKCNSLFAALESDLGTRGKGCRVSCSVCSHAWYQSRDKLFNVNDGYKLGPMANWELKRVQNNLKNGRRPNFVGSEYKMYVGNLDFKCTEDDLVEFFQEKAGDVGGVSIAKDNTGRSRGFAFLTMMEGDALEEAMKQDGEELMGRALQVRAPNN